MITKTKIVTGGLLVFVLIVAGVAAYTWTTLHWSYSKGDRAGFVQKFSKKGWLCETWEGEMQMIPVPGSVPEKFLFSVRDDAVALKINSAMGKKVVLHYQQHKGVPTKCFGETEYFVSDIKVIE